MNKNEEKALFGFGLNDTRIFADTFNSVEELIDFAQTEYDNENSDYFDDEDEYSILVSKVKHLTPSEFAPSLSDIADQMTDRFYSEHNIDDDAEADYHPRQEAEEKWKEFVEKYFDIPCTLVGYADVGWYNLKERKWIEKEIQP